MAPVSSQPARAEANLRRSAIISWIVSGVSLFGVVIGIVRCVRAQSNSDQATAILVLAFSGILFVLGLILGFVFMNNAESAGQVVLGESETWARWVCSPEEVARFVASEKARLRGSSKLYWGIMGVAVGVWLFTLVLDVAHGKPNDLRSLLTGFVVVVLFLGGGFALLVRKMANVELNRARRRAKGEMILTAEGVFGEDMFFRWTSLREAMYEPGPPVIAKFGFPGAAVYKMGVPQQSTDYVRLPVPQGEEAHAREIVERVQACLG